MPDRCARDFAPLHHPIEEEDESSIPQHFIEPIILRVGEQKAEKAEEEKDEKKRHDIECNGLLRLRLMQSLRKEPKNRTGSHCKEQPCTLKRLPALPENSEGKQSEHGNFQKLILGAYAHRPAFYRKVAFYDRMVRYAWNSHT